MTERSTATRDELTEGESPRNPYLERLREIEHLAWHLLDDSEEDAQTGQITIRPMREDYDKLSALLPEDHPVTAHDDYMDPQSYKPQSAARRVSSRPMVLSGHWSPERVLHLARAEEIDALCALLNALPVEIVNPPKPA